MIYTDSEDTAAQIRYCKECGSVLGRYATKDICRSCKNGKSYSKPKKEVEEKFCIGCGEKLSQRTKCAECLRCRVKRKSKEKKESYAPCKGGCGKLVNPRNVTGMCQKCWMKENGAKLYKN